MTVVAYDIADDKRRSKIVKLLEQYGDRINFSVFECMLTRQQKKVLLLDIEKIIDKKKDQVVLYNVCVDCYSKTIYMPVSKEKSNVVVVA